MLSPDPALQEMNRKPNNVGGQEILLADLKNARSRGFGRGPDGGEVEIMFHANKTAESMSINPHAQLTFHCEG